MFTANSTDEERLRALAGLGDHVYTEAEKDLKRKRLTESTSPTQPMEEADPDDEVAAPPSALKGPMYRAMIDDEEDDDEDIEQDEGEASSEPESSLPDLHHYFSKFPSISDENVISMCRAYASYLASLSKKKIYASLDTKLNAKRRRRSPTPRQSTFKR